MSKRVQESEESERPSKRPSYGFRPQSDESSDEPNQYEDQGEEEEENGHAGGRNRDYYIKRITNYAARYPSIEPLAVHKLLDKLRGLSDEELENIYLNFVNAVTELKGTRVASFVLLPTILLDSQLPHFSNRCMADIELKRDIEAEYMEWFGWIGNKVNIIFALGSHAYESWQEGREKEEERVGFSIPVVPPTTTPKVPTLTDGTHTTKLG